MPNYAVAGLGRSGSLHRLISSACREEDPQSIDPWPRCQDPAGHWIFTAFREVLFRGCLSGPLAFLDGAGVLSSVINSTRRGLNVMIVAVFIVRMPQGS